MGIILIRMVDQSLQLSIRSNSEIALKIANRESDEAGRPYYLLTNTSLKPLSVPWQRNSLQVHKVEGT